MSGHVFQDSTFYKPSSNYYLTNLITSNTQIFEVNTGDNSPLTIKEFSIPLSEIPDSIGYKYVTIKLEVDLLPNTDITTYMNKPPNIRLKNLIDYLTITKDDQKVVNLNSSCGHEIAFNLISQHHNDDLIVEPKAVTGIGKPRLTFITTIPLPHNIHKKLKGYYLIPMTNNWKLTFQLIYKSTDLKALKNAWIGILYEQTSNCKTTMILHEYCESSIEDVLYDDIPKTLDCYPCLDDTVIPGNPGSTKIELYYSKAIKGNVSSMWLVDMLKYDTNVDTIKSNLEVNINGQISLSVKNLTDLHTIIFAKYCNASKGIYFLGPFIPPEDRYAIGVTQYNKKMNVTITFESNDTNKHTQRLYRLIVFYTHFTK